MAWSMMLLKKSASLILMVLMGFFSVRSGRLKSKDSVVLSQLCLDWVIPLSLVNSFLIEYSAETARAFRFSCLATLTLVPLFVFITLFLRRPLRLKASEQGSLMFTNSAGMTLPLASSLLGSTGVLLCAPHMALQNFLLFTVLRSIMSNHSRIHWKQLLWNRNIIAIAVGVFLFFTQAPLPSVIRETTAAVGGTISPISMFMIGMLMGEVNFRELLSRREFYLVCVIRLLVYPFLAIALIALSGLPSRLPYTRDILLVLVMCIASPTATLVTQMATAYRGVEEARLAGSLNVMTTMLCVVTIPFMVFLYQIIC